MRAAELDAEGEYMAHLYAMFLLAHSSARCEPIHWSSSLFRSRANSWIPCVATSSRGPRQGPGSVCGENSRYSVFDRERAYLRVVRARHLKSLVTLVADRQKGREEF